MASVTALAQIRNKELCDAGVIVDDEELGVLVF
jgi:hypothetical protein